VVRATDDPFTMSLTLYAASYTPSLELLEGVINAGTPGRPRLSFGPRLDRTGAVPQGEAVTFISSSSARLEMVLIGYKDDL
jgi:hypothetical protein